MSAKRCTSKPVSVPSFLAVSTRSWIWSRPWCAASSDSERVSVHFTGLPSFWATVTQSISSGSTPILPPKPPPTSGAMTRSLDSGDAERHRRHGAQDVRDLGGRVDGDLLTGRVDHARARLHERRDQPLLAQPAADDDRVGVGLGRRDGLVDAAAGARRP